jgi:hypothetical protein
VNAGVEIADLDRDYEEIDALAATIAECSPFQTGLLARVYAASPDSEPTALVIRDSAGTLRGSLIAVTFTHGRGPAPLTQSLTSHTTIRGLPLVAPRADGVEALSILTSTLESMLPRGILYMRCYPDRPAPISPLMEMRGFTREDWLNFLIDLRQTPEDILRRMSKHRRKGIRTAEREGLRVAHVTTQGQLRELYALLEASHRELRIPFQRPELFQALLEQLAPRDRALLLLARQGEDAVAARVILLHRDIAYDWYAGSIKSATRFHADEFLAWKGMLLAKEKGARTFDFGGAGSPKEDYGPREFKRRFGGKETNPGRYTKVLRPGRLRIARTAAKVLGRLG